MELGGCEPIKDVFHCKSRVPGCRISIQSWVDYTGMCINLILAQVGSKIFQPLTEAVRAVFSSQSEMS